MPQTFTLPADYLKHTPRIDLSLPKPYREVVLHCCCAPCSAAVIECMILNGIRPHLFFFNPNIYPDLEYEKRRDELLAFAQIAKLEVTVGDYDPQRWLAAMAGLEQEKERGPRCLKCFITRLTATASFAVERSINLFTTTLATSRWKSKKQVDAAGFSAQKAVDGSCYWDTDWRKQGLVERRYELVRRSDFYNQLYCGCKFSLENSTALSAKENRRQI